MGDPISDARTLMQAARCTDDLDARALYAAKARMKIEHIAVELGSLQANLKGLEQNLGTLGADHAKDK